MGIVGTITSSYLSFATVFNVAQEHGDPATLLPSDRNPVPVYSRSVRNGVQIHDSGWSRMRYGLVGHDYAWPPLVWVGDIYDY
jgi:hypothetical protein